MILELGLVPNAGVAGITDSSPSAAFARYGHPLAATHVLHTSVVHAPAAAKQQLVDAAVAVARVLYRQLANFGDQLLLIVGDQRLAALRLAVLSDPVARVPLSHAARLHAMDDY